MAGLMLKAVHGFKPGDFVQRSDIDARIALLERQREETANLASEPLASEPKPDS